MAKTKYYATPSYLKPFDDKNSLTLGKQSDWTEELHIDSSNTLMPKFFQSFINLSRVSNIKPSQSNLFSSPLKLTNSFNSK